MFIFCKVSMNKIEKLLNEKQKRTILETLLSTGGDFSEVFMEETTTEGLEMTMGCISKATSDTIRGAALRVIKGDVELNASISTFSYDELLKSAQDLASCFDGTCVTKVENFKETIVPSFVTVEKECDGDNKKEIAIMTEITEGAKSCGEKVIQIQARFWKKMQLMSVFASDGTCTGDRRNNMRVFCGAIAKDGNEMQTAFKSYGRNQGMEMFDNFDAYAMGKCVAEDAIEMLTAIDMPGGDIPVVIGNGFGGVILHEACVHGLEATSVSKGMSVFCNKLNTKIASDIVNAVDEGVSSGEWGSINLDDEGTVCQNRKLIENGVLKSYLVDKRNSKKMNHPITGSSRRESYKYQTTSRMTNTYFLPGNSKEEDIIKSVKYGLYCKEMGGGSVQPATGEFNFAVNVGYLIEDGKLTKPVKGATLVGSGKDVLMRIEMIADNLAHAQGMCGSMSGSVPTNVGQPTIKVSHMTVGGKGGN